MTCTLFIKILVSYVCHLYYNICKRIYSVQIRLIVYQMFHYKKRRCWYNIIKKCTVVFRKSSFVLTNAHFSFFYFINYFIKVGVLIIKAIKQVYRFSEKFIVYRKRRNICRFIIIALKFSAKNSRVYFMRKN